MAEKTRIVYSEELVKKLTLDYFNGDSLAADVWIKKYCLKDENNLYEQSPVDMHHRLASELARIEAKYPNGLTEEEIFETIKGFNRIVPAGSPMSGIGNDLQIVSLSNCFVVGNDGASDSYGGILKVDQDIVQLEKRRGGVGTDLSHIRPAGSPVKNSAITSTGVVPFMERYSNTTKEVAQDGRRGALMLSINVGHPDAEAFIDAKLTQGKVTGANVSVKITDEFMEAVVNDTDYIQRFPMDLFKTMSEQKNATMYLFTMQNVLQNAELGKLITVEDADGNRLGVVKRVSAKKIWKKIVYNAWKSAEPGILFWDTIIKESIPDSYEAFGFKTISTNPCVSEDTLILTDNGYLPIGNIVNTEVNVWNGKEFSEVTPKVTGENQKMLKIMFSDGSELKCTPYHGFYTWEGFNRDGKAVKKVAKDLLVGDKLEKYDFPVLDRDFGVYLSNDLAKINSKLYYNIGFFAGDGTFKNGKPYMQLYGEKKKLINMFDVVGSVHGSTDIDRLSFNIKLPSIVDEIGYDNIKKYVPKIQDHKTLDNVLDSLSWLAGLIDSDGSRNSEEGSISISSTDREFLMNIKLHILNTFGVNGSVIDEKEGGLKEIKGHEYETNKSYRLIISAHNVKKLYDLGLRTYRVKIDDVDTDRDAARFITVVSIENIEDAEKVYCFTEPKRNRGCFGGVVTSNCGEIPLCPYDSCRLLSLNLYGYVENPFKPNARFNHDLFSTDVRIAMRYMDDIIDLEVEKIDAILAKIKSDPEDELIKLYEINLWNEIMKKTVDGRRTGLGVTAMGDMLAALGYRYGTDKANEFAELIQKELKLNAYESSVIMAEERGAFPLYDFKLEENNPFIQRIADEAPDLYERMKKSGRRNIALLTIAPTGSMSIVTQTTSGCEPVFLVAYKRRRKINPQEKDARVDFVDPEGISWSEYPVFHHKFKTWLEANDYDLKVIMSMTSHQIDEIVKKSPYYKATSNDVDWVKKVEMQGMLQKHIDHSISVTVNLPADTTEEMVSNVYETAWRVGCKGITVYRDGSRDGVLISDTDKKEKEHMEQFHDTHAPKRPKRVKGEIVRFQNNNEKWVSVVGFIDGRPYEIFTGLLSNGLSNIPTNVKDCEIVKNIFEVEDVNDMGESIKVKKKRYDIEYVDAEGKKQVATGLSHIFNPEYWNYAKLFSGMLRHGMPLVYVHELIESMNLNDATLNTWKNGVARVIKRYIKDGVKGKGTCLVCGSTHLEYIEGCLTCKSCGASACS